MRWPWSTPDAPDAQELERELVAWRGGRPGASPAEERAARMLRGVAPPAALTRLEPIAERLLEAEERRIGRSWAVAPLRLAMAASLVVIACLSAWRWMGTPGTRQERPVVAEAWRHLEVGSCQSEVIGDGPDEARLLLVGPAAASVDRQGQAPLRLRQGRLLVKSGNSPRAVEVVEAGGRRRASITVEPGAVAEVEAALQAERFEMTVAAHVGRVSIEREGQVVEVLLAGQVRRGQRAPERLAPGRSTAVRARIDGASPGQPQPAHCEPGPASAPVTSPAPVAATPSAPAAEPAVESAPEVAAPPAPVPAAPSAPPAAPAVAPAPAAAAPSAPAARRPAAVAPAPAVAPVAPAAAPVAEAPTVPSIGPGPGSPGETPDASRVVVVDERPAPPAALPSSPPPAPAPAPAAPSDLAQESTLLGQAVGHLRRAGGAARALDLLDQYERSFPRGTLRPEARAARVEAQLALGRRPAALATLESLRPETLARGLELRVLRGELRAEAGRCADAVADFSGALAQSALSGRLLERALYGRGSCHARLGDTTSARTDLTAYLERFPQGTFAAAVRRALGH